MKKQTKNTLKVLSTLALAGGVAFGTTGTADAKTYKPEVRYDNGKYFVKTSDPSAKGKDLYLSMRRENATEYPYFLVKTFLNYNGEEEAIDPTSEKATVGYGAQISNNTRIVIQDNEKEPKEITSLRKYEKDRKDYYIEADNNAITLGDAMKNKNNSDEGKVETPQPTKPVETPVKPKEEKKETPTTTPKTTTQTETPKTTQTSTTPEKKVTDKKETPTPKTTQAQEQTKDNKQVTEKKETTAKPLPKTTAETFGGLALYTFGGLSLLSILAFFGLRKKQK